VTVATLAIAAAAWIGAAQQMQGMDMGTATTLGSFPFFAAAWMLMMVAMMLPGAVPAVARRAGTDGAGGVLRFAGSYLGVWALVGVAVYALYRPHGDAAAAALIVAAGAYELTPLKRACRRRCNERLRSGLQFGVYCVGSSIGLMAVLAAVGLMSVTWMAVIALLISVQKLVRLTAALDAALALGLLALGIAVAL
jgi:predicted metal-binding membrane protein